MFALTAETKEHIKNMPRHLVVEDDQSIKLAIMTLRRELEDLHNMFDQATESMLIDSIIYEMQAVRLRYMYYLDLCKQRGIVSEEFHFDG